MRFSVRITDTCLDLVRTVADRNIQRTILNRIEALAEDPANQGKALVKDLAGFRSVHAAGRYRIIFRIEQQMVVVYVLAAGIRKAGDRKDIYAITRKLLRAGLLDRSPAEPE